MILELGSDLENIFEHSCNRFQKIMELDGEVYRNVKNRCTKKISLNKKNYFLKTHRAIGIKEFFKNIFQARLPIVSAKNEKKALTKLTDLLIPVPKIVGFGEKGVNPFYRQSFLITEELPPHISLEDLIKKPIHFRLKQKLIYAVAILARKMHAAGINHRDFYLCHILLDAEEFNNGNIKLILIDLHRAGLRREIPERWTIKDLAGLYFSSKAVRLSKKDYFRFMKHYRSVGLRKTLTVEKNFWHKVKIRGERLFAKHG